MLMRGLDAQVSASVLLLSEFILRGVVAQMLMRNRTGGDSNKVHRRKEGSSTTPPSPTPARVRLVPLFTLNSC